MDAPAVDRRTERVAIAQRLRADGWTLAQIATHGGPDGTRLYSSRQAVHRALQRADAAVAQQLERQEYAKRLHRLVVALRTDAERHGPWRD
ncbi:hypothetical protein ACTXG6_40360 [Pseudonocardia sp. Cha107L01]|uniref:hypothetical protein n=1 Tax=Pseudonocardia sp. Cha107L01 TaxID=3457576 RepID=UPI00403EF666